MSNAAKYAAVVVVLIIVVAGIALYTMGSNTHVGTSSSTSTVAQGGGYSSSRTPIAMTDPAQVPAGTQAMVVSYSAIQVEDSNGAWVSAVGNGSVDLTSTVDSAKVIGYANITTNTAVRAVKFDVNSAYILVNGTQYNVTAPATIQSQVQANPTVKSNSTILVDVSPVVTPTYSQNNTAFVMSSSSKAVVVANSSTYAQVGSTVALNTSVLASLSLATPLIMISSATVASAGNATVVSITVKNDANSTVSLNNVVIYGSQQVHANGNATLPGTLNSIVGGNAGGSLNLGTTATGISIKVETNINSFQSEGFVISGNGALAVASSANEQGSGVLVAPGQNVTLTFSGNSSYNSGMFTTTPASGSQYRIAVVGSSGASATTTVTAS